jgi:hypothetical protein
MSRARLTFRAGADTTRAAPYGENICREQEPPLTELKSGHYAACHFPGRGMLAARESSNSD